MSYVAELLSFAEFSNFGLTLEAMLGGIYLLEQNGMETEIEIVVVAYLDCIYQFVSIIFFIVFIRNNSLPGTSVY